MSDSEIVDVSALAVMQRAEIDTQIATARAFPRSMSVFRQEMQAMVTLSEEVATECIFALPRGKNDDGSKKFIEGASVRFAELLVYNFGNTRTASRFVLEENGYVLCEGVCHDLEKNNSKRAEIRRSITDKYGKRYNADMVTMTINAACALAVRNAILQCIPKALWSTYYDLARKTAIGDDKTLVSKRTAMMQYFQKMNVSAETITGFLGVANVDSITLDDLAVLKGMATAIKEGAVSVDKAFVVEGDTTRQGRAAAAVDKINKAAAASQAKIFAVEADKTALLQDVYRGLQQYADVIGSSPDDIISQLTAGKIKIQIDLEEKPVPYLNDILLMVQSKLNEAVES